MRVALFIPCYIDQLFPDVGLASLELLERVGCSVWVPDQIACCGQPLINTGEVAAAAPIARGFADILGDTDLVVCPSGSCVATLRQHAERYTLATAVFENRIFELSEFLVDRLDVPSLELSFPYRVGFHQSCHALRELGLGHPSEAGPSVELHDNPGRRLLDQIEGLSLVEPTRTDECCGFGGSFSVKEPEVSAQMGCDRLRDFEQAGAEVITSLDMSCLMHLSGLIRRQRQPLRVMHFSQILAGRLPT